MINNVGHTGAKLWACEFDGVDDFMSVSGSDSFTSGSNIDFSITISINLLTQGATQVLYSSYNRLLLFLYSIHFAKLVDVLIKFFINVLNKKLTSF